MARRERLAAEWDAKPKTYTRLPAHLSADPSNFVGLDGLPRYASPELRREVHKRDKGRCAYCRRPVSLSTCNIDHVIPWPKGKTVASNLVVACRGCNRLKGRYDGTPLASGPSIPRRKRE